MIAVTSLGAHRRIPYRTIEKHDDAAAKLIEEGWSLIAVEIADGAVTFQEFEYPKRTCLVLGNEASGVYGSVMKRATGCVFVPMLGKGRSLNVLVAGAIVAYEARTRGKE
jgi:tRNA G18 (ribose-2'-O)-methylase SpoU